VVERNQRKKVPECRHFQLRKFFIKKKKKKKNTQRTSVGATFFFFFFFSPFSLSFGARPSPFSLPLSLSLFVSDPTFSIRLKSNKAAEIREIISRAIAERAAEP
jgi:hypothetical protein